MMLNEILLEFEIYKKSCNNIFEICLLVFKNITFHNKNIDLWEHHEFIYCRCQCTFIHIYDNLF